MKVLCVSGIPGGTRRYRCDHLVEQLTLLGVASTLIGLEETDAVAQVPVELVSADLLWLHRLAWDERTAPWVKQARQSGKRVIFDTDDLVFAPELFHQIAILPTLSPQEYARYEADVYGQARMITEVDEVVTTTTALANAVAVRGRTALIHRNAASAEMVRRSQLAYKDCQQQKPNSTVTLGYFSGSGSHDRDFATITDVLLTLLKRYPHLHLVLAGPLSFDSALLAFGERVRRADFVPWPELPDLIASVDINLAPLEIDSLFCQAKSEIKWMEAALVGVPTVAAATDAFVHAIRSGETGFLAHTDAEWEKALTILIESIDLRTQIGAAARRVALAEYTPEAATTRLETLLAAIQHRQREARAPIWHKAQRAWQQGGSSGLGQQVSRYVRWRVEQLRERFQF